MKKQSAQKKIRPNLQKLPLTEYYNSLPDVRKVPKGTPTDRMVLLHAISKAVGKPATSIRRWVAGTVQPAPTEKSEIAKLLKSTVETLFPVYHE
jgi:hypothetical protein